MQSLFTLAAPLALMLPFLGQGAAVADAEQGWFAESWLVESADHEQSEDEVQPKREVNSLEAFYATQRAGQVRIDQRVVIRISPRRPGNSNSLLAQLPQRGLNTRYVEREMERCVPVSRISGVQTGTGNRLLLFLSDQRIVTVNLERACRARDFYSGFYVERSDDGQLCVDRDELQSRSGAKCEVEAMRQLVAVTE